MERATEIINTASRNQDSKKRSKYGSVSVKTNSQLEFIDHIWAKNGEVYWKTCNGQVDHMSPDRAIQVADQINKDITKFAQRHQGNQPVDIDKLKRKRDEMVEKLIKAYRKAGEQRKHPDNRADELLSYAWHGQNRKGEPFTAENTFSDRILEQKKKDYPFLNEGDIIQFLKSPNLSPQEAERMLKAENEKRTTDYYNPKLASGSFA